jgi:transcriptional regulator with XRE-family HTH domain
MTIDSRPSEADGRRRPAVGGQVRRWRAERRLTLAGVAELTGLNVGYLSQIENDKASPSLGCLAAIADALEVPVAWFLIDDAPAPDVVRASERSVRTGPGRTRIERVDGGYARDLAIVEASLGPGQRTGLHSHAGEEHHIIVRGHWRMTQGDHVVEVGPGDYVRWDGTLPHDAEVVGPDDGTMIIVSPRSGLAQDV